jgi:hypothetical protein
MPSPTPFPEHTALRVCIRPIAASANAFTTGFAEAVRAAGFAPVEIDDRLGQLVGERQVIVLHWPEEFFAATGAYDIAKAYARLTELQWARRRGARLIWVVHDVEPPNGIRGGPMRRALRRRFLHAVDGCVTLSRYARHEAVARYPELADKKWSVLRHPLYGPVAAPQQVDRTPKRPLRLCWFGRMLPYREPLELIAAAAPLEGLLTLSMHGRAVDPAFGAAVEGAAAAHPHVFVHPFRHTDVALATAVDTADAVVLPYARITHSGAALLALGRGKPVLSVAQGALPELRDEVGADWVRLVPGRIDTAALRNSLDWVRATRGPARLAGYHWADQQAELQRFLCEVAGR